MGKIVIGLVVFVGLLPTLGLAILSGAVLTAGEQISRKLLGDYGESSVVYQHDTTLNLGGWKIGINPQWWSVGFLMAGVVLILVGTFAILLPQVSG